MRVLILLVGLIFLGCNRSNQETTSNYYPALHDVKITHAKGFHVEETDSSTMLKVNSQTSKYTFSDSLIFLKRTQSNQGKVLSQKPERIACQSTTHATFIHALGLADKIVGLSDMAYMPKDELYEQLIGQKVKELSQHNTIGIENLLSVAPDIFFMYPYEWDAEKYRSVGVQTVLVAEYLEKSVIARLEWLKFFGILLQEERKADSLFNCIKNRYDALVQRQPIQKTVFFNLPFKDIWDMPSGNSLTVNLIKDAGLSYLYNNESQSADNLSLSKEAVWYHAHEADYWIIIAGRPQNYSLADLVTEEAVYETFKSVKNQQVIFCNTSFSSYFTTGILEPDVMLKDLLFLTHQIDNHTPKYFTLLR
jgi:iron complex transport system substrate-binding protein